MCYFFFLGHNLVEIFSHHGSRIALEDSATRIRELSGFPPPQAPDPRRRLARTYIVAVPHRTSHSSVNIS